MRAWLVFFLLLLQNFIIFGQSNRDRLFHELSAAIGKSHFYDGRKYNRIESIIRSFKGANNNSLTSQYDQYLKLYDEYKIFKFDTAFLYARKLNEIADSLNDPHKIAHSRNKLFFVLLSAGMFKEASDLVNRTDFIGQPDSIKAEYYSLMGRYYYDLEAYGNDLFHTELYLKKGSRYLDSALALFPANSFESNYYHGLKCIKTDSLEKAFYYFQTLLKRNNITDHQLALVSSTLSYIYLQRGEQQSAINYQVRAAIADVTSSTKETFATFTLAQTLFELGDFENAYTAVEKAIEDASFYGARQRKVQVSEILPIIQSAKMNYIERQRQTWTIYGAIATFFLIVLAVLVIIIFRQFTKLKNAERMISEAHGNLKKANIKLQEVNEELQEVNVKLLEANKIKEEYIGYFFTTNSEYFQKIDKFKKALEQKIADRKLDDIRFVVNNINIKKEKEELLRDFDRVFIKLFPNFVEEFNKLFRAEDQIRLKENELLNTDLRIFALIRMGITENEKIAQILEYSVSTIYNYKTKVKMRSFLPKEDFEKKVMSIKSV